MIVNEDVVVTNENKGVIRSRQMTIKSDSIPHLIGVLTNLYSDPWMAIIREYTINAIDSHIAAGKSNVPVSVTLPSYLNDSFVVKDTGVGMSEEDVFNTFGSYGESTKRSSNDFTGQLGLGCKSALTVTNQFSLVTVKEGKKYAFSVHKNDLDTPTITELYQGLTDEHDGVEISIPVEGISEFRAKAEKFFYFMNPKLVTFPNSDFVAGPKVLIDLSPSLKVVVTPWDDCVIMGNVPYFLKTKMFPNVSLVAYAKMGEVDFTPSREELHYTNRTNSFLANIEATVKYLLTDVINRKINSKKTYVEALEFVHVSPYREIISSLSNNTLLNFKGVSIDAINPSLVRCKLPFIKYWMDRPLERLCTSRSQTCLYLSDLKDGTILIGDKEELTTTFRRRLKQWMEKTGTKHVSYLKGSINDYFNPIVVEQMSVVKVEDLEAAPIKRKVTLPVWLKLEVSDTLNYKLVAKKVVKSEINVFANKKALKANADILHSLFPDVSFYVVTAKGVDKFLKYAPTALSISEFLYDQLAIAVDSLNDQQKNALIGFPSTLQPVVRKGIENIKDSELRDFLTVFKPQSTIKYKSVFWAAFTGLCSKFGVNMGYYTTVLDVTKNELESKGRKLAKKYPMLFGYYHPSHVYVDYANDTFRKELE